MTARIVDDYTETQSDKNRECVGQGLGNIVAGLFGGMAGCAMIGQSMINVTSGARGRLSCLAAGIFLLILIVVLGHFVRPIPMAALEIGRAACRERLCTYGLISGVGV